MQSLQVLDVSDEDDTEVEQTLPYASPEALFVGVAYSPDGTRAYASAGGNNKIRVYAVDGHGRLTEQAALPLPTTNPAGQKVNLFPAGLAVAPHGKTLYVADQLADALSTVDVATGAVRTIAVGHNPLSVVLTQDGRRAYVTNQGGDTVTVVDTLSLAAVGRSGSAATPTGSRSTRAGACSTSRSATTTRSPWSTRKPTLWYARSTSRPTTARRPGPTPAGSPSRRTAPGSTSPTPATTTWP